MIGIVYDKPFDPATATEEEQRAAARDFVEKYTKPGKPAMYSAFLQSARHADESIPRGALQGIQRTLQ